MIGNLDGRILQTVDRCFHELGQLCDLRKFRPGDGGHNLVASILIHGKLFDIDSFRSPVKQQFFPEPFPHDFPDVTIAT